MRYSIGVQRSPVETLGATEIDAARALIATVGFEQAAKMLHLDPRTLLKATHPVPVHRMTASMVRLALSRFNAERI